MSVRDILHHLNQVYGTGLSAEQVSAITDGVLEEVRAWQNRVLDPVWPVVFLDAIMVKVRDNHVVTSKPAYIGLGVDADGDKHFLGIWIAKTPLEDATAGESARFWASVMAGLRNRGVRDVIIACCDGLAGFEDAIHSAFPAATVQTCVAHLIRNALRPVARKDRDAVAKELRKIYSASNADAAFEALAEFASSPLGNKYPRSVNVWENAWDRFIPFFAFTPGARKLLYTTNSIESLNYQLRKVTKTVAISPATPPPSNCCGWPSSTSRTSVPANAPAAARKPANATTSPHGSSKDSSSWPGAKHSTNSTPPIPGGSGNPGNSKPTKINLHT